jgi:cytochrome oxidase Cu insertion factor (SCO1/SenC/PrrC family)
MKTILLIVMAAGLAAGQSTGGAPLQLAEARKPAADFALRDAAGRIANLKQYRGKIVLLDFRAIWCTGCKQEIPWFVGRC